MGAPQRAEITFFMKPGEEGHTLAVLSQLKTQPMTQSIVDRATPLYRKWNPSHGIDTNDVILAAMSMETGGRIYTLNVRHFPMPGLDIVKAW
jgi:predicted nucleic acid-binding protein